MFSPLRSTIVSLGWLTVVACTNPSISPSSARYAARVERALPAGVVAPRPVAIVAPKFPYDLRRTGEEAVVQVHCFIDEKGAVVAAEALPNGSDRLRADAPLGAASAWKFAPGTKHGIATPMQIIVPVNFTHPPREEAAASAAIATLIHR